MKEEIKINGHTLIELGFTPDDWFRAAIEHINANQLSGEERTSYLKQFETGPVIELHSEPVKYSINIKADNELEEENIVSVKLTMDEVMRTPTVVGGSIMPDSCPAGPVGTIPVGGVVVTKNAIHPGMHSGDICCSVFLTDFGKVDPKIVLDAAHSVTHFGPGGRSRDEQFRFPSELLEAFESNRLLNEQQMISAARSHLVRWKVKKDWKHDDDNTSRIKRSWRSIVRTRNEDSREIQKEIIARYFEAKRLDSLRY
jgi:hypothetical protein